jgi:adenylosuccinate synthase
LFVSEKAHVIMPYHRHLDLARETRRSGVKIGTNGPRHRPAYEDKFRGLVSVFVIFWMRPFSKNWR